MASSMRRILLLSAALFLFGGTRAAAADSAAAPPRPPNIVVVMTDGQRWDALGCAGHPFLKTPNIDRLAREGALFQNAFVTTPLCSPSRASFLTGQYAHKHGVRDNTARAPLRHHLPTFPPLLHDAGYQTSFIGKRHMGLDDQPPPGTNRRLSVKRPRV